MGWLNLQTCDATLWLLVCYLLLRRKNVPSHHLQQASQCHTDRAVRLWLTVCSMVINSVRQSFKLCLIKLFLLLSVSVYCWWRCWFGCVSVLVPLAMHPQSPLDSSLDVRCWWKKALWIAKQRQHSNWPSINILFMQAPWKVWENRTVFFQIYSV